MDQPRENDKEKEARGELLVVFCHHQHVCGASPFSFAFSFQAAASLFNAASSDSTEEQQAAEDALREAMSSPSRVRENMSAELHCCIVHVVCKIGRPDRSTQSSGPAACLPDLSKCPEGWSTKGWSPTISTKCLLTFAFVNDTRSTVHSRLFLFRLWLHSSPTRHGDRAACPVTCQDLVPQSRICLTRALSRSLHLQTLVKHNSHARLLCCSMNSQSILLSTLSLTDCFKEDCAQDFQQTCPRHVHLTELSLQGLSNLRRNFIFIVVQPLA